MRTSANTSKHKAIRRRKPKARTGKKDDKSERCANLPKSETLVQHLHSLIATFPALPSLLQGKVRNIKIEPHYRESRLRLWGQPVMPKTTCKIRLTGNWIAKAGFAENERIRVIPMKRMLIIIPE